MLNFLARKSKYLKISVKTHFKFGKWNLYGPHFYKFRILYIISWLFSIFSKIPWLFHDFSKVFQIPWLPGFPEKYTPWLYFRTIFCKHPLFPQILLILRRTSFFCHVFGRPGYILYPYEKNYLEWTILQNSSLHMKVCIFNNF